MADMGTYLDNIDWGGGLLVGGVAILIGVIVNWFLQASLDETLSVVPWLRSRIATAIRNRDGAPTIPWVCPTCRSVNDPAADFCYRGCGARIDLVDVADERPGEEQAVQHVGRG
ncbi:MAG TPA: hypothetical protein VH720_00250 [Candidatus Limnocylindrales bacterium]|jgi:hypothetical protein